MRNKFHKQTDQRMRMLISFVGLLILTIIAVHQTRTVAEAQTIAEKRFKPELVIQTGHTSFVQSIAFSPDGKTLATASFDKTIKLWNVETSQQIKSLEGHSGDVTSVVFSPDGKKIISGSYDQTIKLWNAETGQQIKSFEGHTDSIDSVALSPDGKILASGSRDKTVKLWSLENGQQIKSLEAHTSWVTSVAFSPNGKTLASGSSDKTVRLWNVETGQQLKSFEGHDGGVEAIAFSPDGKKLVSGSQDRTMKLWEVESGRQIKSFEAHFSYVSAVAFSPDGKTLASGSYDRTLKLWNVETGQLLNALGDEKYVFNSVIFSPDGKTLATSSGEETVILWSVETGRQIKFFESHSSSIHNVVFSPDGKIFASSSHNKTINLWSVETGQQIKSFKAHTGWIDSIAFSPDGKTLVSGSEDKTMKLWDVESGRQIKSIEDTTGSFSSVLFLPDGKTLISINILDNIVRFWDVETGRRIRSLIAPSAPSEISPDGKTLVWQKLGGTIELWSIENGRLISSLDHNKGYFFFRTAFSPDGKTFASGGIDKVIKLWNLETGQLINSLVGHSEFRIESIVFSPDGKTLASAGDDKTVRLWDVETGQQIKSFEGHKDGVETIAFSPDGKTLISGSQDATIKLWDLKNYKLTATLTSLDKDDWVVTTPDSNFDASLNALKLMHFVVSDPKFGYEVITLDQLKSKSFTPGLFKDIYAGNKSLSTGEFSITLYPSLEIDQSKQQGNRLNLKLENRGGGIGRVEVYLNGKEFLSDARAGKSVNPKSAVVDLPVEIPKEKLTAGANKIEIITWNTEGDVRSRSKEYGLILEANGAVRGSEIIDLEEKPQTYNGNFYAVIAGISDYSGSDLDLRFAAKDAEDMSQAVALGARRLFCAAELKAKKPCERVHVRTLSTEKDSQFEVGDIDFRRSAPTKQNFREVFAEIAAKTKPEDVVMIYFAGHATASRSEDALQKSAFPDLYIYPTMEAETLDKIALGNKDLLDRKYLTSLELADWVNQIKAERKAMIFDTCAAGAIQTDLTKQARNDDNEDKFQIRALDRLRERTGFFVLMGSAADAVSYEASSFRQGLLTYSLLEAMSGAKLRDDRWIDVEDWFKYAEEKVDNLARGIGGIQRPRYFKSNFNAQSFDVGEVDPKVDRIPLAAPVPMILQPVLLDKTQLFDSLNMTEILIPKLRELSINTGRSETGAINYVPARAAKGGIIPSGLYTVSGESVTVELVLRRDEKDIARLEVKGTKIDIAEKLLQAIISATQGK